MSKHSFRATSARILAAAAAEPTVSCATPDQWTGAARLSTVPIVGGDRYASYPRSDANTQATAWNAVSKGQWLGRARGSLRAYLIRTGGIWHADPATVGLSPAQGLAAFRNIGVRARYERGVIVFRSRDGDATATRALSAYRGVRSGTVVRQEVTGGVGIDVAVMRLEGRYSKDAPSFVDALAGGMEVYPFGTSYVVRVPSSLVPVMWDAIDTEGGRTFLVGASSPAREGDQIAGAIRFCGANALLSRFPTPTVRAALAGSAIVEIEAQRVAVSSGEVLMTVQSPVQGRGIEVAISRLKRR
jgi:hypothetical protein